MNQYWQFSPIPYIEESTFHKVLERFYHHGISGLVRENIQNSLDGKLQGSDQAVVVTIKTGQIDSSAIPGMIEVKDHISCLVGQNTYTKETIAHMQSKMNQSLVSYISFEDEGTKGLSGARNGQSTSNKDTWSIYAYNKGVHSVEEDASVESSRGGSHGIGKIASNAASDLYMMYFANCDEFGDQHLGGTVQLIEHEYEGEFYRSTGYFAKTQNSKFYPFENNYHEVFKKETRGLKIIIPFLREQFNNEVEIIKSVCDSFFIAILQGKLEVNINEHQINSETLHTFMKNSLYYEQELHSKMNDFTPLYYQTYTTLQPKPIVIKSKQDEYEFDLYFTYNLNIPKGRVGVVRTIGMKIEDKKVIGHANKPYNAVLIPKSSKEDGYLKSLENESHTELSYDHIKDQKLQADAKRFINNIGNEIKKEIEAAIKANNPTDGVLNTGDVIYTVESKFKQDLAKSLSSVKLKRGSKEQTVVKIETTVPKKKPKAKESGDQEVKQPLKRKKRDKEESKGTIKYQAQPDRVRRVLLPESEVLHFDFSNSPEVKNVKSCNVSLAIVDGMGKEFENELALQQMYKGVIDQSTKQPLEIVDNVIKDVKLKKGIAQLRLQLATEQYNKSLKYVYYVEV